MTRKHWDGAPETAMTREPRPEPPPVARDGLLRKYRDLADKYTALVEKLDRMTLLQETTRELFLESLAASCGAMAMVRNGRLTVMGGRWEELAGAKEPRTFVEAGAAGRAAARLTLGGAVKREAAALLGQRRSRSRIALYNEVHGGGLVVELHLARPGRAAPGAVTAMCFDVTERAREETELAGARHALAHKARLQALGELASGVAHDLNNVLHAVGMRLALVKADPALPPGQRANLAALEQAVADGGVRIGQLQDFARTRHDRPLEALDVGEVIGQAVDLARTEMQEKRALEGRPIAITTDLPALPPVPGVPAELRHVFVNLLLNARDAMPAGGTVTIAGRRKGGRIEITVSDEGGGIPAEALERIFDPFFTTKDSGGGSGLGLATAYGVMRRLGGEIRAANRPRGGAIFTLVFPEAGREARAPAAAPPAPAPAASPRRVLVVDDDADLVEATTAVIAHFGHHAVGARSGREALARVSADGPFDVVLCDVGMPDLDGWDVARSIQTQWPDTRVYMLTGWAQEIRADDPRRALATGVLPKPLEMARLREVVEGS